MASSPSVPNWAPGTKGLALQVNGGFDGTTGAFLGITCTVQVTLPDGTVIGQTILPLAPYLPPAFIAEAQQVVPQAVRDMVIAQGMDYG